MFAEGSIIKTHLWQSGVAPERRKFGSAAASSRLSLLRRECLPIYRVLQRHLAGNRLMSLASIRSVESGGLQRTTGHAIDTETTNIKGQRSDS